MKTVQLLFAIAFAISTLRCPAQSKEEEIVFEYAVDLLQNGRHQEAANSFEKFLVDFPKSPLKGRAHFNLALTFKELGDRAAAKATFQEILAMPYNEKDENSLMEPYTLYKHHSCRMLAFIALDENDYKAAERYIEMFDRKFPYRHFCGNEWSAYNMFKAVMLARVYAGTNRFEQAVAVLVPYTFSDALASNHQVLQELETTVRREFTKAEIREQLLSAMESLKVTQRKDRTIATIRLFNTTVEVEDYAWDKKNGESPLEHFRTVVVSNQFFKKYLE